MEKERLYEVTISEEYYTKSALTLGSIGLGSCRIAEVTIKSESAEKAGEKALEKVKNEIELDSLCVSDIECIGQFQL